MIEPGTSTFGGTMTTFEGAGVTTTPGTLFPPCDPGAPTGAPGSPSVNQPTTASPTAARRGAPTPPTAGRPAGFRGPRGAPPRGGAASLVTTRLRARRAPS